MTATATMTIEEKFERFLEEERENELVDRIFDAIEAGDLDKMRELSKELILDPESAMQMFRVMGKENLLETCFNLSAADKAFGEGWMDVYPTSKWLQQF